MEEVYIDRHKPLWWVLLVIFCMALIYSIGTSSETDESIDDFNPSVVENINSDRK